MSSGEYGGETNYIVVIANRRILERMRHSASQTVPLFQHHDNSPATPDSVLAHLQAFRVKCLQDRKRIGKRRAIQRRAQDLSYTLYHSCNRCRCHIWVVIMDVAHKL